MEAALIRECIEETGFRPSRLAPFAYRRVTNAQPSEYPPLTYLEYFWALTTTELEEPTDPGQPANRIFSLDEVKELAATGKMNPVEAKIIEYGLEAAILAHT